ncbi:hypothetical protein OSTOST_08673 [Ostertagia ostertagi]
MNLYKLSLRFDCHLAELALIGEWNRGPRNAECEMKGVMGKCIEGSLLDIAMTQSGKHPCIGRVLTARNRFGCAVLLFTEKSSEHHITVQCLFDSSIFPTTTAKPPR